MDGDNGPLVVIGAGYSGLTVAHRVWHRSKGKMPILLIDRHPFHVLRTQLYEIGELAASQDPGRWTVPLSSILDRTSIEYREGTIDAIDLASHVVHGSFGGIAYQALALCLGNVGAYYGVPGASEHCHQVYDIMGAQRLARSIREVEVESAELKGERRPRIAVIGGGSTGTELAADIATTDWRSVTTKSARLPEVVLVTGSLPFLAGLPASLIRRAQRLLREAGVNVITGLNTTRIEPKRVTLEDGTVLACDIAVWCAGLETPPLIRDLPVRHGKGGRIAVGTTLEVPDFPNVFAVGDVAEIKDVATGMFVPQTAQAAIAEARTVAENIMAKRAGRSLRPFTYHSRGTILTMGRRGAASVRHIPLWGRSASWLKRMVEQEYARAIKGGEPSGLL